jgi:hypothetical protein
VSLPDSGSAEIIAFVVVGILAVVMRWVFKPSRRHHVQLMDASDARELGLLTVIATLGRIDAMTQRTRLTEAGIRASMSSRRDGRFDVLVFTQDADRAREMLS